MISIFSMPGCKACDQAASLLERKGVPYKKVDIYSDDVAMGVMQSAGLRSVPQLFIESDEHYTLVGDYNRLKTFTDEDFADLK